MRALPLLVCALVLSSCATVPTAEEYGTDPASLAAGTSGEYWKSPSTGEGFGILRSVKDPNSFIIAENTGEAFGDAVLAGATLGISQIFDFDTQEEWFHAAKEYTRIKFGAGARVINFRRQEFFYKAYAFEVMTSEAPAPVAPQSQAATAMPASAPAPAGGYAPQKRELPKNDYAVGKIARTLGCGAPHLLTSNESTETFQTACPGGQSKIIQCEFTNCRVMQ